MHDTTSAVTLGVAVFLASAVESVEALTIIVAAGVSRGWRSALEGMVVAICTLAVIVGALGPALVYLVPVDVLRAVVGTLLLVFGLQWLRKAVLRATGFKAKHDEDTIFKKHVEALSAMGGTAPASGAALANRAGGTPSARPAREGPSARASETARMSGGLRTKRGPATALPAMPAQTGRSRRDPAGFVVAFKGTFLEGLEIVVIVLGLGSGGHQIGLASAAAGAAILAVAGVGLVVARQLAGVPENAMKTVVGLMLVSFGTFWAGEGLGVRWPGSDLAIVFLLAAYAAVTWVLVQALRQSGRSAYDEGASARA
ncbi:MAG: COG4280 domain-containing protein [Acidimicrobiales bacterium]